MNHFPKLFPLSALAKGVDHSIHFAPILVEVARLGPEAVWGRMETRAEGLSEAEAQKRGKAYGPNVVAEGKRRGWPWRLIKALRNP